MDRTESLELNTDRLLFTLKARTSALSVSLRGRDFSQTNRSLGEF
jgi:hypothetical protein